MTKYHIRHNTTTLPRADVRQYEDLILDQLLRLVQRLACLWDCNAGISRCKKLECNDPTQTGLPSSRYDRNVGQEIPRQASVLAGQLRRVVVDPPNQRRDTLITHAVDYASRLLLAHCSFLVSYWKTMRAYQ